MPGVHFVSVLVMSHFGLDIVLPLLAVDDSCRCCARYKFTVVFFIKEFDKLQKHPTFSLFAMGNTVTGICSPIQNKTFRTGWTFDLFNIGKNIFIIELS